MRRYIFLVFIALCACSQTEVISQNVINPYLSRQDAITYSSEGQTVFTNLEGGGGVLTENEKIAIDRFVISQVKIGNWSKIVEMFCFHLNSQAMSLRGWKAVRNATLTATAPTWSQTGGFVTNGTSSAVNSNFVPSTDGGGLFLLNDSNIGAYVHSGGNGTIFGGFNTAVNQAWLSTNANAVGNHLWRMWTGTTGSNVNTSTTAGTPSETTFDTWRRSSTFMGYMMNGEQLKTSTLASNGLSSVQIALGARNDNGTLTNFNAITAGGMWFSAAIDFDYTAFDQSFRNLMQELNSYTVVTQPLYPVGWEPWKYTVQTNDALVYIMFGQSNQDQATGSTTNIYYPKLQGTITGVTIWTGSALATLQSGVNQNPGGSVANGGFVERFAHTMNLFYPNKIYIIKFARGATGLAAVGGDDWNVGSPGTELYGQLMNTYILPGLSAIAATGKTVKVMGIDFDQGENEASIGASTYQTDLINLMSGVTGGIRTGGYDISNCVVTIKRLHNQANSLWTDAATVRSVHEYVGLNLPSLIGVTNIRRSIWWNADNPTPYIFKYQEAPDPVHYDQNAIDKKGYTEAIFHTQFVK